MTRYDALPEVFFSGGKGFHVSLPTGNYPGMSAGNHEVAKVLACRIADEACVTIDSGVYDPIRLSAWPNSRHPRTGLYKVHLDAEELDEMSLRRVLETAAAPVVFDVAPPCSTSVKFAADWDQAAKEAPKVGAPRKPRNGPRKAPNRLTQLLIHDPGDIKPGERHRVIFSAAADLAEFETTDELIAAIVTPPALHTGLPPREVARQIECGIAHTRQAQPAEGDQCRT